MDDSSTNSTPTPRYIVNKMAKKKNRSTKCKPSQFAIDVKLEILQYLDEGASFQQTADRYGVPVETIAEIAETKVQIYDTSAKMKLAAAAKEDKAVLALDEPLVKWINSVRDYGLDVVGTDIQAQADQLATDVGLVDFTATKSWLARFRLRNIQVFRTDSNKNDQEDGSGTSGGEDEQAIRMAQLKKGKPRIRLTISQKMDVIKYVSSGKTLSQTRDFFGLPCSTIHTIVKSRAKTEEAYDKKLHHRQLIRNERANALDDPLVKWIHDMRAYDIKLVGDDIRQRALELAAEMNLTNFTASAGWLGRFRERNKSALAGEEMQEEEPEEERLVDDDHVPDWVTEIRRKNEIRRLSFPVQASITLALGNGDDAEGDEDAGYSDEDLSREAKELSHEANVVDTPRSRRSKSPLPLPQRRPSPPKPTRSHPPPSQQQQRSPRRGRPARPPQPPPPSTKYLPPPPLQRTRARSQISPAEELEKSLIALEMDHIRRMSTLLKHHKLLLVVDDGKGCRMSGDPGLQNELFAAGEEEEEETVIKTEPQFLGNDGEENPVENSSRGPSISSVAGGKRKSATGNSSSSSSKKRKRKEEGTSAKNVSGAGYEEGGNVGAIVDSCGVDVGRSGGGDGVAQQYGEGKNTNGQKATSRSPTISYEAVTLFPARPSDDHRERNFDVDEDGVAEHLRNDQQNHRKAGKTRQLDVDYEGGDLLDILTDEGDDDHLP